MDDTNTYNDSNLLADLVIALEGYMDINDIPYVYQGTLEESGMLTENRGIFVSVNGQKFQINVLPA